MQSYSSLKTHLIRTKSKTIAITNAPPRISIAAITCVHHKQLEQPCLQDRNQTPFRRGQALRRSQIPHKSQARHSLHILHLRVDNMPATFNAGQVVRKSLVNLLGLKVPVALYGDTPDIPP